MATNIELSLLTRVVETHDFHTLEKLKIDESYFLTPEAREVYRFLRDTYHHPSTAGRVPTVDFLRYKYPSLYLSSPPDAVSVLCSQIRTERIRMELLTLAQSINDRAGFDPASVLPLIQQKAVELSAMTEAGTDLSMANAYDLLWNQYSMVQNTGGMLGIPYPWAALNEETQGMQKGQFLVLFGRPKSMKTWVAGYMAKHAYFGARKRVLFYTKEMNVELVSGRIAALFAGVDYKAFKNGKLQPELRDRVFYILRQLKEDELSMSGVSGSVRNPYFILTSNKGAEGGVSWLRAKIRETDPDLVIVDGMYLMHDDRGGKGQQEWQRVMHISRDLKGTAQEFNIPIIGVTQANRGAEKSRGEDLTELAFSDALGQDADAVFRVSKVEKVEENIKRTYIYLTAPGLREGKFDGIVIRGEPAANFDYVRTMVPEDSDANYEEKKPQQEAARRSGFTRPGNFVDPRINNSSVRP